MGLLILLVGLGAGLGVVAVRVYAAAHPDRVREADQSLAAELSGSEPVAFRSADGVELSGWLMRAGEGRPAIVLCHDLGGSKAQLVNLGIYLQKLGFNVLGFDFRGHGRSAEAVATMGVAEKRDVLGAVDFLAADRRIDARRLGIYGTGMGAHAAALAAADRASLRVLVLDGLYPDARYKVVREVYRGWRFGSDHAGFVPELILDLLGGVSASGSRAADVLPTLRGRDVLLVSPAGDSDLATRMQSIYETLPHARDVEANLVTLPGTGTEGLYGEELARYHERIGEFFATRLARP